MEPQTMKLLIIGIIVGLVLANAGVIYGWFKRN